MSTLASVTPRDVIANRPAAGSAGRLFFATDQGKTYRDSGTVWEDCSDKGVVTSVAGRTGAVVLAESDVANLVSDLADKAPLASPTFTGTPAAPTASAGTNTTQLATTAFVQSALTGVGSGTVTSVAVTVPSRQSVTGSPVTSSGTLAIADNTQNANVVFAGPSSGAASAPTFRSLAPADLGTGTADSTKFLRGDGTWAAPTSYSTPTTTKGDLIVRGASADSRLAVGADGTVATADSAATLGFSYKKKPFAPNYYQQGKPTATTLFAFIIPKIDGASITVTWPANFSDAYGVTPGTNPSATAAVPISKNGTQIGTVSISTAGVYTFASTSGATQSAVSGDKITYGNPSDSTLSDFGWTLPGTWA